eukprot:XP_011683595.1 PREDICTED: uncharacterized protein LOC100889048 [Strongylocentrotus purpuratus]
MAAYYAGLHKRLKDNSVPIADRVKLARFGWVSNHCFLPNKHQVLLDWVSFRLVNSEKDGTSDADEQSLWLFLHDALKSQEMASIQREGKPICLRGNLCSALLSTLLKDDVSDIVIGCCDMILTNEKLRFVQNTKFESLIAMTVALVEMASKHLEENVCLDEHGQILRVMGKALAKSSNFLQQQQNGKKAYGLTSEQLILPCLRLYSILSSCRHGNSELCVAGLNALNNSFRSLLFSRNMAEAYKMYLMSEEGDKQKKDGRVRADVVDKFMDFLQSKSGEASTICGFPVIYSAFLTSFKPSPDLTFAMLQKMCSLMDFKTDGQPSGSFDDASWDRKLCTMEALLKLATSHKCYAVVEEETERTKKMEWFKEIVSHLMANKRLHPSWYGCLDIIFSLDHNILATRMQEVWPCLLATNASMAATMQEHDDADDARVGESRDAFLKSVMETYTKLRQIDRLTKVLLSSILTKKEFSSSIQLPASFLTSFGAAVESLTPGSTVALWDIIMSDITTNHLPAIMHHASQSSVDPPPAKKKRKVNKQVAGENGDAVARFEASATVLHTFLMNSKMADAAEVGQVKGQVLKLFDMMADDVLKPLLGIFSHENQSLAFSTLLLCYGWGELHLMLRQHTNLMERVPLPTLNTPMKNGDVHYLHTYSHASDWLRVMSPSVADGNEKLCFLKHQLLWQQARGLVLLANLEESSVKESLTSCISQALELSVERSESNSGRWDGLIGHATQSNIYTALLTSLLSQSLTLFTFMDESMHSSVAGLVCQAVCGSMHSEDNTNECSACTVRNAALGFLDSEACRESRPMQNAVVNAVADQLKELNKSLEAANLSNSKKDGKKDTHSKGKKQSREIQHSKGNQMLSGEDNFKTGVNLLEVLKHLPLLHLSASNRVNCMLGLVSLDTKTVTCVETMSPAERQKSCDLVELSTEVRRLLTAILKGVQQGDEVLRNEELNTWFFSFLSELGNLLSQHANEDVEKMLLGNKCDMDDKRMINKDRGETVRETCFLKTGVSEGPRKGKSFYICGSTAEQKCNFVQETSLPPSFCLKHSDVPVELQGFGSKANGELRQYYRCTTSKQEGKGWCGYVVVHRADRRPLRDVNGISSLSSHGHKHRSESNVVEKPNTSVKSTRQPSGKHDTGTSQHSNTEVKAGKHRSEQGNVEDITKQMHASKIGSKESKEYDSRRHPSSKDGMDGERRREKSGDAARRPDLKKRGDGPRRTSSDPDRDVFSGDGRDRKQGWMEQRHGRGDSDASERSSSKNASQRSRSEGDGKERHHGSEINPVKKSSSSQRDHRRYPENQPTHGVKSSSEMVAKEKGQHQQAALKGQAKGSGQLHKDSDDDCIIIDDTPKVRSQASTFNDVRSKTGTTTSSTLKSTLEAIATDKVQPEKQYHQAALKDRAHDSQQTGKKDKLAARFDKVRQNDSMNMSWRDSSAPNDDSSDDEESKDSNDDDDCRILEDTPKVRSQVVTHTENKSSAAPTAARSKEEDRHSPVDPSLGLRERLMRKMKIDVPDNKFQDSDRVAPSSETKSSTATNISSSNVSKHHQQAYQQEKTGAPLPSSHQPAVNVVPQVSSVRSDSNQSGTAAAYPRALLAQRQAYERQLQRQKDLMQRVPLSSLPDGGQRLKQVCADLETAILKLDKAAKSYKPPQLSLSAQGVASAAHTSGSHIPVGGSLQQTSIKQHFQPLHPASQAMAQQRYQQAQAMYLPYQYAELLKLAHLLRPRQMIPATSKSLSRVIRSMPSLGCHGERHKKIHVEEFLRYFHYALVK